jgi:hypothetical protein
MTDDFELYDARYAENFLGDGYPCFFCGVNGLEYTTRPYSSNLLCEECASRYGTKDGHLVMCSRIRELRARRYDGDINWEKKRPCPQCTIYNANWK